MLAVNECVCMRGRCGMAPSISPPPHLQLRSLKGKVAVVAMVGMYRTGKSYLLNQLAGRESAFNVRGSPLRLLQFGVGLGGGGGAGLAFEKTHTHT